MAKNNSRYLYKNGGYRLFNTILKYLRYISWWSVFLVEETIERYPPTCHFSMTHYHIKLYQVYIATQTGIKFTDAAVICNDCIGTCKLFNRTTIRSWIQQYPMKHMKKNITFSNITLTNSHNATL